MIAASTLLLSLSLTAYAAPSKRQSRDNGSCQALQSTCAASVNADLSNAWDIKACIFGASCFGGKHPVDGFLAAVYAERGETGTAPTSVNLPRVTNNAFNLVSGDGKVISQQNFVDGYYSSLDPNGPYPTDVGYVTDIFQSRLQDWTHFCNSGIPEQNFADYYQYSSTVNSVGGCTATGTVAARQAAATPVVSSDATCQKMFESCTAEVDQGVSNPWANKACVLGATCFGGQTPVDGFLSAVYTTKNPGADSSSAPTSRNVPRLPTSLFNEESTDGQTWTQQNFIDYYYSVLSVVGGPFPSNTDLVVSYFGRLLSWTAFCPGSGIPYMNVADYFQYSSTVQGGQAQC